MPEKILPTLTDAIAVRPESIPTPIGKTEKRELRSTHSKTFLHAEKSADGKEIRTCQAVIGAVCYRSDAGELRSIDTTVRDIGDGVIGVEWAPYQMHLHADGIGFDFWSREGGQVSVMLTGIGGEKFDQDTPLKPGITDNTITFRDVRPGCDIVFKCLNQRVKTLRILRDANAPRTFEWQVDSDRPELVDSTLTGTDANGNQLELSAVTNGNVISETWDGVGSYPVTIDPDITSTVAATADDGTENNNSSIDTTATYFGTWTDGSDWKPFWRFMPNLPQGATVDVATLNAYIESGQGSSQITGTLYAWATDNATAFSGSNRPSTVTATTASTAVSISSPGSQSGWKVMTCTSIVQEIANRAGWAANNGLELFIKNVSTYQARIDFEDYQSAQAHEAYLSVTYTAPAGGGTAANLLLLGCG